MGTRIAKAAFLVTAMMFFAVLALDIAIPTLVLCIMVPRGVLVNSPTQWSSCGVTRRCR